MNSGRKDKIEKDKKKRLTKLVNVDGFTSFSQATFTHTFDLNDVVVIGRKCKLHFGVVGGDSEHVIVSLSPIKHL